MKTFIESPDFLGNVTLHISLPVEVEFEDINPMEKLNMVEEFFDYMEKNIRLNYIKERSTPVFEGIAFSKLINNYYTELNKVNAKISDYNEIIEPRNMSDHDWYIFDKAFVTLMIIFTHSSQNITKRYLGNEEDDIKQRGFNKN